MKYVHERNTFILHTNKRMDEYHRITGGHNKSIRGSEEFFLYFVSFHLVFFFLFFRLRYIDLMVFTKLTGSAQAIIRCEGLGTIDIKCELGLLMMGVRRYGGGGGGISKFAASVKTIRKMNQVKLFNSSWRSTEARLALKEPTAKWSWSAAVVADAKWARRTTVGPCPSVPY